MGAYFLVASEPMANSAMSQPVKSNCVEILGLQGLVAKADFGAQRSARCKRGDLVHGELALGQDVQHFAAHVARGADDDDFVAHRGLLRSVLGARTLRGLAQTRGG